MAKWPRRYTDAPANETTTKQQRVRHGTRDDERDVLLILLELAR